MKYVSRRDVSFALITGLTTGASVWGILSYLGHRLPFGIAPIVLVPLVPILWVAGVQLGYVLAKLFHPFKQFGKFAAIGFANASVDFGVLYILIAATGIAAGIMFSVFKTISFVFGVVHSYFWNKYWTFEAGSTAAGGQEFISFTTVAVASMVVNVGIATIVLFARPETFTQQSWAGISAIAGASVSLVFSFLGFRLFVFKKK